MTQHTQDSMLAAINPIFKRILGESVVVSRELDAKAVETWDSLNLITLIVELESEFSVSFTSAELGTMLNVGDFVDSILNKLNKN